jgi:hypothetical protein
MHPLIYSSVDASLRHVGARSASLRHVGEKSTSWSGTSDQPRVFWPSFPNVTSQKRLFLCLRHVEEWMLQQVSQTRDQNDPL